MEAERGRISRPVVGVDVGGTFTDLVLFDAGRGALEVCKVPSTSADQSRGVVDGLERMLPDLSELDRLIHGTTVATNTLLEGTGARVALITTAGFRDVLEIGRTRRMLPSVYDTTFVRPPPLVPRPLRFEVAERIDHDGAVLASLDEAAIEAIARRLRTAGVEALAVCFLHSYANADHEHRALDAVPADGPGDRADRFPPGGSRVPGVRTLLDHGHQRLPAARHEPLSLRRSAPRWPVWATAAPSTRWARTAAPWISRPCRPCPSEPSSPARWAA